MSRSYPLLGCILLLATSLPAQAARQQAPTRPYIETSHLIAPRHVGEFELEDASFDPDQKYSGAGFRYALKDHQEIRFDVYAYPVGRMPQASAVESGMVAFRKDLQQAAAAGSYTELQELQDSGFALPAEAPAATSANDIDAAVVNAQAEARQITGRKLQLRMNLQPRDWPMYSNGYLFYKQHHYFKLRASAAQERIAQVSFDALADRAARELLPAIEAVNIGDCAKATITVSTDAAPEAALVSMFQQIAAHQGYN